MAAENDSGLPVIDRIRGIGGKIGSYAIGDRGSAGTGGIGKLQLAETSQEIRVCGGAGVGESQAAEIGEQCLS